LSPAISSATKVAHGVHAVDAGVQALVGDDPAPVDRDAGLLEAEPGRAWSAADRHEHEVGVDRVAVLERDAHPGVVLGDPGELHAGDEVDLAPAESSLQLLGEGLVLERHQAGERLDDRDVGPEGLPDAGELDPDDAAADDDDPLRHPLQLERLVAGDDPALDGETGQGAGIGPGGEDYVAPLHQTVADLHGVLGHEPAQALDQLDLVRLDQALQPLVEPLDHAVLVGVDAHHVDALERGADPETGPLASVVGDLGRVQEGFGGDAAVVQAGPADLVGLDQRDRKAQLSGPEGACVAAAPTTEDHDIEHGFLRRLLRARVGQRNAPLHVGRSPQLDKAR
jgi:hypothetical protein